MLGNKDTADLLKEFAAERRLAHSYIFHGPWGVGKKTLALSLANYLENGEFEEPAKVLGDVLLVEPVENTLGIDAARAVRGFLSERPNRSPYRTVILNDAERLTEEAANALLKIAEEPPPNSLLILISADLEGLNRTLQSRFQKLYMAPVAAKEMEHWLLKVKKVPAARAKTLAAASFGKPGLALKFMEDKSFAKLRAEAGKLLQASSAERKKVIKALADKMSEEEDPDFNLTSVLDALILLVAPVAHKNSALWHKVLELRGTQEYFSLNPRVQLGALLAHRK